MSQIEAAQFAAYIGIDWADEKHDICLATSSTSELEFQVLKHHPQAIDEWAIALRKRFKGGQIAVCLEQTKGPLIYALLKYDFLVLYPVNRKAGPASLFIQLPENFCHFRCER